MKTISTSLHPSLTFMDEDTGWITTREDWNTGSPYQIDFVISSSSLVCDTGVDEHMDFATGSFISQRKRLGNTRDVDSKTWLWIACIGTGDSTGGRAHSPRFAWLSWETDLHGFVLVYVCIAEWRE